MKGVKEGIILGFFCDVLEETTWDKERRKDKFLGVVSKERKERFICNNYDNVGTEKQTQSYLTTAGTTKQPRQKKYKIFNFYSSLLLYNCNIHHMSRHYGPTILLSS